MLLPDPSQRIPLDQIMVHPWFTTSLPAQVMMGKGRGVHPWFNPSSLPTQVMGV